VALLQVLSDPGKHVDDAGEDSRLILVQAAAASSEGDHGILNHSVGVLESVLEEHGTAGISLAGMLDSRSRGADVVVIHLTLVVVLAALVQVLPGDQGLLELGGNTALLGSTPSGDEEALVIGQFLGALVDGQAHGFNVRFCLNNAIQLDDGHVITNLTMNVVGMHMYLLYAVLLVRRQTDAVNSSQIVAVLLRIQVVLAQAYCNSIKDLHKLVISKTPIWKRYYQLKNYYGI